MRLLLPILLCLVTLSAEARCRSTDYRDHLTPEQTQRLQSEVARIPFAEGNHWIATKGNRRLHIIGTMHTGDARMAPIVRRLRPIVANADALLLEVTKREADASLDDFDTFRKYMLLPKGQTLSAMMPRDTWTDLATRLSLLDVDPRILDRLQPWFASELLDQVICVSSRPQFRSKGLDSRLERVAIQNRVPIGSLETVGQSLSALLTMPKRDHIRLMQLELARQEPGKTLIFNELDDAYFEEKIGEILVMSRWSLYTDYQAPRSELDRLYNNLIGAMLTLRNRNWMPVLLNTKGDNLVVAMGAAHLPGREGVLNLLKQRGYRLERVPF